MDLDHLETFRAVSRSGSFTGAAEVLHYAQSTVSVHIRALEQHVGAPLFDRLPAGVRLTDAGRRLLPLAEQILQLVSAIPDVSGMESDVAGEVTIAAPETIIAYRLPAVLSYLRELHPKLKVRLEAVPYHDIRAAVAAGELDVGYLLQPQLHSTSAIAVQPLRQEKLLMVAAPDHPLSAPVRDVAEEFSNTTLFYTERGCGYRPLLEAHLDRHGIRPGHTLEFGSVEAIRRYVEAGLGVALLPEAWLTEALAQRRLVSMDWFGSNFAVVTQVVWNPSRWQGQALTAVLEATRHCIGKPAAGDAAA